MAGGRPPESFYVIAYDIPDDRRRTRIHKILRGFGRWTQYSVFECHLTDKQLVLLRARLLSQIKPDEDSLRIYPLCASCLGKGETIGSPKPEPERIYLA